MRLGADVSYLWNVGIKLMFQMGEDIMIVGIKSMFRMGALWEDIISVGVKSMLEWKKTSYFWVVGIKVMFVVGEDIFVSCWFVGCRYQIDVCSGKRYICELLVLNWCLQWEIHVRMEEDIPFLSCWY